MGMTDRLTDLPSVLGEREGPLQVLPTEHGMHGQPCVAVSTWTKIELKYLDSEGRKRPDILTTVSSWMMCVLLAVLHAHGLMYVEWHCSTRTE